MGKEVIFYISGSLENVCHDFSDANVLLKVCLWVLKRYNPKQVKLLSSAPLVLMTNITAEDPVNNTGVRVED